jgi:hypothetical protein
MSMFGRSREDEDDVRNAFVFSVLLHLLANFGRDSVERSRLQLAVLAHYRLLEYEGIDLSKFFYGDDHRELEMNNSIIEAIRYGTMYARTGDHRDLAYFDRTFRPWAEREIREHLSPEIQDATNRVIETTAEIYRYAWSWEKALEKIEEYKRKKEETTAATK